MFFLLLNMFSMFFFFREHKSVFKNNSKQPKSLKFNIVKSLNAIILPSFTKILYFALKNAIIFLFKKEEEKEREIEIQLRRSNFYLISL